MLLRNKNLIVLTIIGSFALLRGIRAIEATPEGINSAVTQLTSSINDQTSRISALDSDLYSLATKNEAVQLDSAIQNIDLVKSNMATMQELSLLQTKLNQQTAAVNDALLTAGTAEKYMDAPPADIPSLSKVVDGNSQVMEQRTEGMKRSDAKLASGYQQLETSTQSSRNKFNILNESISAAAKLVNDLYDAINIVSDDLEPVVEMMSNYYGYSSSSHAVVYRYAYINTAVWTSTSSSSYTWLMGNDASSFGGSSSYFSPSGWANSYPYAYEFQYDTQALFNLRSLCTQKGYGSSMTSAFSLNERLNTDYDAQSGYYVMLFRIENTTPNAISHRFYVEFTSYYSYEQPFSVALNGNNIYYYTSNCDQCATTLSISFPPSQTSTLMFISTNSYPVSWKRPLSLGFSENTLNLPDGLRYVDDLDTAPYSIVV